MKNGKEYAEISENYINLGVMLMYQEIGRHALGSRKYLAFNNY